MQDSRAEWVHVVTLWAWSARPLLPAALTVSWALMDIDGIEVQNRAALLCTSQEISLPINRTNQVWRKMYANTGGRYIAVSRRVEMKDCLISLEQRALFYLAAAQSVEWHVKGGDWKGKRRSNKSRLTCNFNNSNFENNNGILQFSRNFTKKTFLHNIK